LTKKIDTKQNRIAQRAYYMGFVALCSLWMLSLSKKIMKRNLLRIICCPVCKGNLLLKGQEGITGTNGESLFCQNCEVLYPIEGGIPVLERRLATEISFCGKCGKDVEAAQELWTSFWRLKGAILRCPHCNQIVRKTDYKDLDPVQQNAIFKKFLAKGSDITAPTYESLRAPLFSIIMLGINPFAWKRRIIQVPSQRINVRTGETVLDVATGTGLVARELSEMVGLQGHVCGLDISMGMLKMARKKANQTGLTNITYIKGDSEELPFQDRVLDGVTCFNTIVTEQVIAEISRVLRKGSKLVTTVGGKTRKMSPLLKIILKLGRKYGFPVFYESEITELLEKYDFKDVHCLEWIGPILPVEAEKR